jgi:hypothetical protein
LATSDSLTFLIVAPDLLRQKVKQIVDMIDLTRSFQNEEALFNHITSSLAALDYAFPHFHNRSRSESRDIVLNATIKRVHQEKMCLFEQSAEPTNNANSVIDFSAINTAPAISAYNTASAAFSAIDVAPAVPAHNKASVTASSAINAAPAVPAHNKASVTASSAINAAPAVPAHNKASAAAVPLSTASLLDIYGVHEDFFEADDADALGETEGEAHNQISIEQAGRKRIASTVSTSTSKARKLKHTVGLNRLQQTTITFAPLSKQTPVANLAGELLDSHNAPLSSRLRSRTTVSSTDTTPSVVQQVANTLSSRASPDYEESDGNTEDDDTPVHTNPSVVRSLHRSMAGLIRATICGYDIAFSLDLNNISQTTLYNVIPPMRRGGPKITQEHFPEAYLSNGRKKHPRSQFFYLFSLDYCANRIQ